jgi:hypothetical protein
VLHTVARSVKLDIAALERLGLHGLGDRRVEGKGSGYFSRLEYVLHSRLSFVSLWPLSSTATGIDWRKDRSRN